MDYKEEYDSIRSYFNKTFQNYGPTPKGVDWNNEETRAVRFEQLIKVVDSTRPFSILDYGSGYGALVDYFTQHNLPFSQYVGYDLVEGLVAEGNRLHPDPRIHFTARLEDVPELDYATACGVFNMKQDADYAQWTDFVVSCLDEMNAHGQKGFSVNFLTKYSDADRMRADLYYADPCFYFDYCKTHFSRNVAVLHDYNMFDFTVLVRK
ncbi:MAG: class I SAM-dependent methyltransferase [Chloroflexi bacterium]|nr:class I SAM-dependent methyltransferase [Anaerolineaceae bacterium]NMB90346.1 class I SAM-dependent methyltransferase [Chloroflexota bacterium]